MSYTVSVIMGIYNCEKYLEEALDSLINQTFQDFEIIMCDDGSSDSTFEIAREYVKKYGDKITLLKNDTNLGLNKTLNKCLQVASGKYIARMDGDDISLPNRFEIQVKFLDENPQFSIVSSPMIYFDDNGDWGQGKAIQFPQIKDFINHSPFFCHAPCMIRREAYESVGGYSEDPRTLRFEDCHLWYKMYAYGYRGCNITEPLYKMRDDKDAFSRRTLRSRINAVYVMYVGFKMVKMPWYTYVMLLKILFVNVTLGIIPSWLYMWLHKIKNS